MILAWCIVGALALIGAFTSAMLAWLIVRSAAGAPTAWPGV